MLLKHSIVTLSAILFFHLGNGQETVCPIAGFPTECDCYEDERSIACPNESVDSTWDIRRTFEAISESINNDSIVWNRLYFQSYNIPNPTPQPIPENTITGLKFKTLILRLGPVISTIHANAFPSTYESTEEISIYAYDISQNSESLDFLNNFPNLQRIDFYGGVFSSISASTFHGLQSLRSLVIGSSAVEEIGDNAFAVLPNLEMVSLQDNLLTNQGISPNAFVGLSPNTTLRIPANTQLKYLTEDKFKILLDQTNVPLIVGPSANYDWENYMDCDERVDWICANAQFYQTRLQNYKCRPDLSNYYIWDYCNQQEIVQTSI